LNIFVGVTDYDWFTFLAQAQPDEVNFWRPSATRFAALKPGEPFLFKLKSPIHMIAGGGFFVHYLPLPLSLAWEVFENKNGAADFPAFRRTISAYLSTPGPLDPDIGCIVLTQPVFLHPDDWIDVPGDWYPNIVSGKTYSTEDQMGNDLWLRFCEAAQYTELRTLPSGQPLPVVAERPGYGEDYLTRARLGQGGFRSLVIDAYHRRCAMTGERTLPALQASHIKPYAESGPHRVDNGMLLRADLHVLFDRGYLTVTQDYHIEVSPQIKEEYENGRDYYAMHGTELRVLPTTDRDRPSREFIDWHNREIYLP
jgi:putative restriction endonuclease